MEEILEELDMQQLEEVVGGNALDTTTGSFVTSPGTDACYGILDGFGLSRWFTKFVCER
jgi:hypothetical protein